MSKECREYTADDILRLGRDPLARVDIAHDALPGGLSAAMVPALVDWNGSSLLGNDDDFYLVKNINVSTNPVAGTLMLGTVRVPAAGVERAEWVFVPTKLAGRESPAGHAMVRLVFRDGSEPEIASNEGETLGRDLTGRDLVFSWEAWRPPRAEFDPVAGLEPETYALTLRASYGPTRCLSDSLFDRPWVCYPLHLADVPDSARDVLHTYLLLGDSVARHTVGSILNERIADGESAPHGYDDEEGTWEELRSRLDERGRDDLIGAMLDGRYDYHLIRRSCITLALMTLDTANVRAHRRAGLGEPKRIRSAPGPTTPFLDHVAHGRRVAALLALPTALHWLRKHPEVIPARAHELIDEVGLLVRGESGPEGRHFDNREVTPYGRLDDHLIY